MGVIWKKPIMDHMIWYKEHVIKCCGMGQYNGQPYRHIFPPDMTDLNFFDGKPPEARWLKPAGKAGETIRCKLGFDHMNSSWVMGLNLFPHLFETPESEQALLHSLLSQGVPSLLGQSIEEAWFEEEVGGGHIADLCLKLTDGQKILIHLFYYNFSYGDALPAILEPAQGKTHSVFVLLKQNTFLNPDCYLEETISQRENRDNLHVVYWEKWLPCLISLLTGSPREYAKELYRKNLDF